MPTAIEQINGASGTVNYDKRKEKNFRGPLQLLKKKILIPLIPIHSHQTSFSSPPCRDGGTKEFWVARRWRAAWQEMAPACHLACQWATLTIYGSTSPKKFSRYSFFVTRVLMVLYKCRIMSLYSMLSPLTSSYASPK